MTCVINTLTNVPVMEKLRRVIKKGNQMKATPQDIMGDRRDEVLSMFEEYYTLAQYGKKVFLSTILWTFIQKYAIRLVSSKKIS